MPDNSLSSRWSISRRSLIGGMALTPLMLSACGGAASSGAGRKIRFGHSAASVASSTAMKEGIFAKYGLDVELVQIQSGPSAVAATVGGALDFTFGDFLGWAAALANGFMNCKLVCPANGNGNLVILGRKGIDRPEQLVGRRIGVGAAPVFALSTELWLRQLGIDKSQVEFVIVNNGAEHILGRGDVDALLAFDPSAYEAQRQYGAKVIAGDPTQAVMPEGAGRACYYVNGDYANENPEAVESVVAALREGAQLFVDASPQKQAELLSDYIGFTVEQMERDMPGLVENFRYPPPQLTAFDVAANQAWVDIAAREKAISKSVDIAPYVHSTALVGG